MGKRGQRFFWHVPLGGWFPGSPGAPGINNNVGGDIISVLVDTEAVQSDRPDIDDFVIERVIGQYMLTGSEVVAVDHFVHHRVYVADSDSSSVAVRSLNTADDAETSFLWHRVEAWHENQNADVFGIPWTVAHAAFAATPTPWMGRHGHFDIKVGRRIGGGQSLIWHTELLAAPLGNDTFNLKLWCRVLLREG